MVTHTDNNDLKQHFKKKMKNNIFRLYKWHSRMQTFYDANFKKAWISRKGATELGSDLFSQVKIVIPNDEKKLHLLNNIYHHNLGY